MQDVIDALPEAVCIVSDNGSILALNELFANVFGYAQDELLNHKIEILVPDEIKDSHEHLREDFNKTQETRDFANANCRRGKKKDGTLITICLHLGHLCDGNVLVIVRDQSSLNEIHSRLSALSNKLDNFQNTVK